MSDSHIAPVFAPDEADHSSPVRNGNNRIEAVLTADHPLTNVLSTDNNATPKPKQEWVKFDEAPEDLNNSASTTGSDAKVQGALRSETESTKPNHQNEIAPAVLDTESVHINATVTSDSQKSTAEATVRNDTPTKPLSQSVSSSSATAAAAQSAGSPAVIEIPIERSNAADGSVSGATSSNPGLRTIELSGGRVREGFANGDIIVTLLPVNTKWPWITPATFRPELVPEELMAQGLTLTVEEYVHAMETLVNDYRFTLYNICYKRILCCWIVFAFSVLMGLLFSGLNGIALFSLGVGWLFLNASAIFLCMWLKLRLSRGLERCIASVNRQLLRHKIIVVLDDRGNISCHKVNLCFMYYEPARCVKYLNDYIARSEQNGVPIEAGWEARLDVEVNDIVIQGSNTTRVSRKQDRGEQVLLRYLSRWGRDVMRGRADVSAIEPARHFVPFICPCQYVEMHLHSKPRGKSRYFMVCDGLLTADNCNSITFIFFSIFLILGIYALYMVDFQRRKHAAGRILFDPTSVPNNNSGEVASTHSRLPFKIVPMMA